MDDLKLQMKDHFIKYASYVILERAIPNVVDGLNLCKGAFGDVMEDQ